MGISLFAACMYILCMYMLCWTKAEIESTQRVEFKVSVNKMHFHQGKLNFSISKLPEVMSCYPPPHPSQEQHFGEIRGLQLDRAGRKNPLNLQKCLPLMENVFWIQPKVLVSRPVTVGVQIRAAPLHKRPSPHYSSPALLPPPREAFYSPPPPPP